MKDCKTQAVEQIMLNCIGFLSNQDQKKLREILDISLYRYDIYLKEEEKELPVTVDDFNLNMLKMFLVSRAIESLSKNSLSLYKYKLGKFIDSIDKKVIDITTDDIRYYLAVTKQTTNCSNTTLENTRLIISSFFNWLVNEEYITKNPVRKIASIKSDTIKEEPFTQEELELLCMACSNIRDRALIEFLYSTGCRVSEVCSINRNQIDFYKKELQVIGKGNKLRTVFLSDKCCVYLKMYLESRKDNCEALFATNRKPYNRMKKDSIESTIRAIGNKANVPNTHPHRFRRTLCCSLIDKGMPIQDCKDILGHSQLDTTLIYYNGNSGNLKHKFQSINNI